MTVLATAALLFVGLVVWMHPRLTTAIDRHLALSHLEPRRPSPARAPSRAAVARAPRLRVSTVDHIDGLLRDIRSGAHPRDAVARVVHASLTDHVDPGMVSSLESAPLPDLLPMCAAWADAAGREAVREMFVLLGGCLVEGAFIPASIEHARSLLRTREMLLGELRTATTQAALTGRILATLPFGALAVMAMVSPGMRATLVSGAAVAILTVGVVVNRIGSRWTRVLVRRALGSPVDPAVLLTEHVAVSLRAGRGIVESLCAAHGISPEVARVSIALGRGHRLEDALADLPRTSASMRLEHTLLAAHRDGLPIASTVHQLVTDAHDARRQSIESALRRLPVRLAFPTVLCTLPSFLLITLAPMLLTALGNVAPAI